MWYKFRRAFKSAGAYVARALPQFHESYEITRGEREGGGGRETKKPSPRPDLSFLFKLLNGRINRSRIAQWSAVWSIKLLGRYISTR